MPARKPQPPAPPAEEAVPQRIVKAARRRYLAHGFRRVTMDDLAEELGMSKKTLYALFPSKRALLEAVLLDKLGAVDGDLAQITSGCAADVPAALHALLACMQRHLQEIQPSFVRDVRRDAPDLFQRIEHRRSEVIQRHFEKILGEGRRAGIIRRDVPTRLIIEVLLGATHAIMNPEKMTELDLTPKAGFSFILKIILEGALTEKGREKL